MLSAGLLAWPCGQKRSASACAEQLQGLRSAPRREEQPAWADRLARPAHLQGALLPRRRHQLCAQQISLFSCPPRLQDYSAYYAQQQQAGAPQQQAYGGYAQAPAAAAPAGGYGAAAAQPVGGYGSYAAPAAGQQQGAPTQQYAAPPQQYSAPPQQYGAPAQAPQQQAQQGYGYGAPQY